MSGPAGGFITHGRSLSVPAPSECLHRGLACCLISMRGRLVLLIPVGQYPHPGCPHTRRCGRLKNAPDDYSSITWATSAWMRCSSAFPPAPNWGPKGGGGSTIPTAALLKRLSRRAASRVTLSRRKRPRSRRARATANPPLSISSNAGCARAHQHHRRPRKPARARVPPLVVSAAVPDLPGSFTSLYLSRDGADGPRRQVDVGSTGDGDVGRRPK
jgi:hypothetical protein